MRTLGLLLFSGALACGLAWFIHGHSEGELGGISGDRPEGLRPEGSDGALSPPSAAEEIAGAGSIQTSVSEKPAARLVEPAPVTPPLSSEDQSEDPSSVSFTGELVLPSGERIEVASFRAELRGESGPALSASGVGQGSISFRGLTPQVYELSVQAEGYTHDTQVLDYSDAAGELEEPGAVTVRVILWPSNWIPLVIRTADGRPFRALAEDLGWEARQMFVKAFDIKVSAELAGPGSELPALDPELATFHVPSGNQVVELASAVAGSLELHVDPPLWAGLWIHGQHFASGILRSTREQLYFEIDHEDVAASLSGVELRVVDSASGLPVAGARVTLKADISSHRRADLSDQETDADGVIRFGWVMPGEHVLTILREGSIVQRILTVKSATTINLGDVPIGSSPELTVRVVDVRGNEVPAWIEIGPFERGRSVRELYPPNIHRKTSDDGHYSAPVPDRKSIIRARPLRLNGTTRSYPHVGSLNHLIDPAALLPELVIIAQDPVALSIEPISPWGEGHSIRFEDELGLVVELVSGEASASLQVNLVPGVYTARRFNGDVEVGSLPGQLVSTTSKVVRCP
jgi:hypothetical protein